MLFEDQAPGGAATTALESWPPPSGPPAPAPRPPRRARPLLVILAVVLVGVAGALAWRLSASDGPPHPGRWDPRVADLAEFVEAERGLQFHHPVFVDFLPEDEFRKEVTADEADLSDEERRDLSDFESLARAVGLVRGDVDLFEAGNRLSGEGVLAFYDPETDRVKVRGTEITVGLRATLVHELTHALQDQHFDLSRQGTYDTDAQNSALEAVVEGDALRIEHAYLDTLSEDERAAYDEEMAGDTDAAALSDVPEWLSIYFSAPYLLGEPFVDAIVAAEGPGAVDEALRNPPASEEQLMDAARYLAGDEPASVKGPRLEKGDRLIDEADFGTFSWLVVLAERIPAREALAAVDGWGGDAYAAFERDGRVCMRAVFEGDTPADTDEMAGALEAWTKAMPAGAASVKRRGDRVELFSCDPGVSPEGADASQEDGNSAGDAMTLLVNRSGLFAQLLWDGAGEKEASCFAAGMVREFSIGELESAELPTDFEGRIAPIGERCGT